MIGGPRCRIHGSCVSFQINTLPAFKEVRHLAWPAKNSNVDPIAYQAQVPEWLWHVPSGEGVKDRAD